MVSMIFPGDFFQEILFIKMNNGTFIKSIVIYNITFYSSNLNDFSRNYRKDEIVLAIRKLKKLKLNKKLQTSMMKQNSSVFYNAIA